MKRICLPNVLLFTLCFSVFASLNTNAQAWKWARGLSTQSEGGNYCAVDTLGNIYVAGSWGPGAHVYKYDSLGNLLWSIATSGGHYVGVLGLTTDLFGNEYILAMYDTTLTFGGHVLTSPGPHHYYFFVSKISSSGSVEWIKGVGNVYSFYIFGSTSWITTDSRGDYYITCSFANNPTIGSISLSNANTDNSSDILVAKFDSSGTVIWAKSFSGRGSEWPFGISVTSSNHIYIDGYFNTPDTLTFGSTSLVDIAPYAEGFLAKLDSDGNAVWAKGIYGSQLYGLTSNSNEDVFITGGYSGSSLTLGSYVLPYPTTIYYYGLLAKYDSSGMVSWAKAMQGNYVVANSPTIDPCGNVWIISTMGSGHLTTNDTIDGHVLAPLPNNGTPNFIACWSNSGTYISSVAMKSGGLDLNGIVSDRCGNIYVSADQEDCDTMVIAIDTSIITSSDELEFIAKYNPNLGCTINCGGTLASQIDPVRNLISAVYPNPASTELTITSRDNISSITITNLLGQRVYINQYNSRKVEVNVSDLPTGVYFIKINGSEVRRFVKH